MNQDLTIRPPIRVLVVDDSAFMRAALSLMIASESGLEVVATACSGAEGLEKIASLDPDVVTLDVAMPGLNGLDTLRCIMKQFPRPVIMVSASTDEGAELTLSALAGGAFDYVPKRMSSSSLDIPHIRQDLIAKIRAAAQLRELPAADFRGRKPPRSSLLEVFEPVSTVPPEIIALGISTGGPRALQEILPLFPGDFFVPILIVQHMPPGFTKAFAQRMNALCSITVREAIEGESIQPGVYIAPAGMHMTVERPSDSRAVICLDTPSLDTYSVESHVPSIDVLMKSVAKAFGNRALGVIMTGMGSDGAEGMTAIRQMGGMTIGQDEASCTVYSMPGACAELGVLSCLVPLLQIPAEILRATRYRRSA